MSRVPRETAPPAAVAVLFGCVNGRHENGARRDDDPLDELAGLAEAADVEVAGRLSQRIERPVPATYIGSGKVDVLRELVASSGANLALAGMDLSPAQVRNLTRALGVRVVDRSELIMDIFAGRARTAQAKLQVELAQLQYALPRLRGQWAHLDRYRGGGVGTRGPGEKQLETDRRLVNRRIRDLQHRLSVYESRTQRSLAGRKHARKIALAGYTNTGKSTLFNALTGAQRLTADRLFATLDTRTRKWSVPDCEHVILSDTVGFVRDLPHHLVASFHATLEEVVEADLILHVVDTSGPHVEAAIAAVLQTLQTIGAADVPTLTVLNKADRVTDVMELQAQLNRMPGAVVVSARTRAGLDLLEQRVREHFAGHTHLLRVEVPAARGEWLARFGEWSEIVSQEPEGESLRLTLRVQDTRLARLRAWATTQGLDLAPCASLNGR